MSDPVDDLLRRAMATLDDQTPSGYFDTLADRTLARLDGPALAAGPPSRGRRAPVVAALGVGLAAAAAAVIFVSLRDRDAAGPPPSPVSPPASAAPAPTSEQPLRPAQDAVSGQRGAASSGAAAAPRSSDTGGTAEHSAGAAAVSPRVADPAITVEHGAGAAAGKGGGAGGAATRQSAGKPIAKLATKRKAKASGTDADLEGDPTGPSRDDVERGMTAVGAEVRACFDGTAGVASVRLSVAPSGRVERVTVSGPFAGTPVGACVERAVRTATFPPWHGAPKSFDYRYLLPG
jgi:hypothetical protein